MALDHTHDSVFKRSKEVKLNGTEVVQNLVEKRAPHHSPPEASAFVDR
jgi:hypothetical protein